MIRFPFVAALLAITLGAGYSSPKDEPSGLPGAVREVYKSVQFVVSPQVELMSIVQAISDYPKVFGFLMQADSSAYKHQVLAHFGAYRDHPVVKWLNATSVVPRKMNFSAPSNIMLYVDGNLDLRTDLLFDDFVLSRAGGLDSLNRFLGLLKDFAVKTGFNRFFEMHNEYYHSIVAGTIARLDTIDHVGELESFFGIRQKSYSIILVSLYSHVGYGNSVVGKGGGREVFDTMGPQKIIDGVPFFGDGAYLTYLTRHEFSHPFVNPLTERHWDLVKDSAVRYDSIPERARRNVCGDWQECINEFTVRAITVHVAFLESEAAGRQAYEREKANGVSYLDPLLAALREYAGHRSQYPTFGLFYPKLLEVLTKPAGRN